MNAQSEGRRVRRRLVMAGACALAILGSTAVAAQMSSAQTLPTSTFTTTSTTRLEQHCPMTTTPPPCSTTTLPPVTRPTTTVPVADHPLCRYRSQFPEWLWQILVGILDIRCGPPATTTTTTTTTTPGGEVDCGGYNAATGWPTTTVHQRNSCLLNAFANGTHARLVVYTTTTPVGTQLLKTTYEVTGVQLVRVTTDPTRASSGTDIVVADCTTLSDDGVKPAVGGCTQVSSTPVTAPATQTTVVVTPSSTTVPAGQPVVLNTTVVTATGGQPVPTGYITLIDGIYPSGGANLDASGHATLTISRTPGIYYYNVVYSGADDQYRSSVSAAIRIEVTA